MKIAILYICTGRYNQFFSGFYNSCETFFYSQSSQKTYFVFTDNLDLSRSSNVQLIRKECNGFPLDSLFRFKIFLEIEDTLKNFDYIFFFNANMLFVAPIESGFLPTKEQGGIAAALHPGYYKKSKYFYPYERNRASKAYIPLTKNRLRYYMGSLNGGLAKEYLELINECAKNIDEDYSNKFIAVFHDESHLNKYLTTHLCLALSPSYAYPEDSSLPFPKRIIIRDKVKIDNYFDKGRKHSFFSKVRKGFILIYRTIIWQF